MIHSVSKAICITIPLAMILAGCGDRRKGTATPEAAAQYEEVVQACVDSRENEWMQEDAREREIAALIGHFDRTADASYATPNLKLTMLHLACLFKKPELARCLLRDGADANARCVNGIQEPAETPLIYAVSTVLTTEVPTATCTELIDVLIAGGAKPELSEWHGNSLLMVATYLCDQEEIVKHLLRYIPEPTTEDLEAILLRGWYSTLEQILSKRTALQGQEHQLLHTACHYIPGTGVDTQIRCAELLLQKGADIHATNERGLTPLMCAIEDLPGLPEEERGDRMALISFLLNKGASTDTLNTGDSDAYGLTAYDMLALIPGALEELAKRGHKLEPLPVELQQGALLPGSIIRANLRGMSPESIRANFDAIAAIFTPNPEQMAARELASALEAAVAMLARVDVERAQAAIAASPLWQMLPHRAEQCSGCTHQSGVSAASLAYAVLNTQGIAAPKQRVLDLIQAAENIQDMQLATDAVTLLGRNADAAAEIEKLKQSAHAALRAGAWGAELQRKGLPAATNGSVRAWLAEHKREADTPILKTALLATSLDEMWHGNMLPDRKAEFMNALRSIGAPEEAIKVFGQYAENMHHPEVLDKLEEMGKDWSYELEIATARFIIEHEVEFLPPQDAK